MKKVKRTGHRIKHYEPFLFLMVITILVITGFQVYWLKNNYDREKRTMQIKANVNFQEAVRRLQVAKLKLKDPSFVDSFHKGKTRMFIDGDIRESDMKVKLMPKQEIVTIVNAMRDKMRDSLKEDRGNSTVIVSMNKEGRSHNFPGDSLTMRFEKRIDGDNKFFQFLYQVDSLQDSLKINEITAAYQKRIKEENLTIPFTIVRLDKVIENNEPDFSNVTVGFVHPITYRLDLGNAFPYLIKQITLPILFSIFLVGVTILSFMLLYRNLLKQQRLSELKNEFISNITHELKTPIATVGVAIEALKNFDAIHDPQRTKEYLDISANELQRLNLLVDKVLKLSMFEKKEIELKYETLDLKNVVEEVTTSMRLQLEKHNAKISIIGEGDLQIQGDKLHLQSVIFNLLDNALKYGKNDPVIHILLQEQDKNIVITLSDNGIGIAPEYSDKVFDKFFRIPHGNTHNAKGYGLGLSYVAHVVQKHRGIIKLESEAGIGTKFIITLPKQPI